MTDGLGLGEPLTAEEEADLRQWLPDRLTWGGRQRTERVRPTRLHAVAVRLLETLDRERAAFREAVAAHQAAEERLALARQALIATGYFTADEVGPDIAPRITELFSARATRP